MNNTECFEHFLGECTKIDARLTHETSTHEEYVKIGGKSTCNLAGYNLPYKCLQVTKLMESCESFA